MKWEKIGDSTYAAQLPNGVLIRHKDHYCAAVSGTMVFVPNLELRPIESAMYGYELFAREDPPISIPARPRSDGCYCVAEVDGYGQLCLLYDPSCPIHG